MDIGHRLKAVRTKAALSQRELAKRSGVTNGFISQIEKNQVSPSVASLRKVLEGIPMSLASFFTDETEMDSEVIFRADDMPDRHPPHQLPSGGSQPRQPRHRHDAGDTAPGRRHR